MARALYRILQAHRPSDGVLEVLLRDWGSLCGIIATAPDKIRRILTPAHDELLAMGYLESVTFEGRGSRQVVTYRFQKLNAPDPALVQMLSNLRITRPRAEQLAAEYPERVEAAVRYVEERMRQGKVKSSAALAYDILVKPEKYDLEGGSPAPASRAASPKLPDTAAIEQRASEQFVAKQEQLPSLSPEDQWEANRATLKLLTSKYIGQKDLEAIQQVCVNGQFSAVDLTRELTARKAKGANAVKAYLDWLMNEVRALLEH